MGRSPKTLADGSVNPAWARSRAQSKRAYRTKRKAQRQANPAYARASRGKAQAKWRKRIIAIDGEGWFDDWQQETGYQPYRVMVAMSNEWDFSSSLANDDLSALSSAQCFNWLLELGKQDAHITSFAFDYDITQMCIDLPLDVLKALKRKEERRCKKPPCRWAKWRYQWEVPELGMTASRTYYLDWTPRKKFVVGVWDVTQNKMRTVTVWDSFAFHQRSLTNLIENWRPDWDEAHQKALETVKAGKARRNERIEHTLESETVYAQTECAFLAQIQTDLFNMCDDLGYPLQQFHGPGSIAAVAMKKWDTHRGLPPVPRDMRHAVDCAFFGGRFENSGYGLVPKLHANDIVSAYPHALTELPCLRCSYWEPRSGYDRGVVGLWRVRWRWQNQAWGYLPARHPKTQAPYWPLKGENWVWSWELDECPRDEFEVLEGFALIEQCSYRPFAPVRELYDQRAEFKAAGDGREKVCKLILNSLYGKLAQTVGAAPYSSPIWAGMVTSHTRAKLIRAMIQIGPQNVIGTATDAVYTLVPLPGVTKTSELGAFSYEKTLEDVLIVQPGLLASRAGAEQLQRTRGIRASSVPWDALREAWETSQPGDLIPCVSTLYRRFVNIGLTLVYNDKKYQAWWEDIKRDIAFESEKRPVALRKFEPWQPALPAPFVGPSAPYDKARAYEDISDETRAELTASHAGLDDA